MKDIFFNTVREIYLQKNKDMILQSLKKKEEKIEGVFSHHYHQEEGEHYNLYKRPINLHIFIELKGNNSEITAVSPNHSMFKEPKKVIELLLPYIYEQKHKDALEKLINGEEIKTKIDVECQANKLVYFFKELFEGERTTFTTKKNLGKWIMNNFRFLKNEYADFKADTIQRTLMRDCKPPKKPIKIE